ncbi:hypothetical protein [Pantoea sp. BAV 3049]|uniref:hypothetical protein n=1 Tax=Pantoea sp. BAV 3049 TaxID=2654188 RepID=UPI00131C3CC1|nr:hypothetical protein [Pantoea sp. BAV 3049]
MPSPISGRIPVAPDSRDIRNLRSNDRVNIRLALEPGNRAHRDCEIKVSRQQFDALQVANQAIGDTHRILFMGVGDQRFHSLSTNAETLKRQLVMRKRIKEEGMTPLSSMWEAKRYRVGNCGEMAMVCGQLIASSGLNQPVSVVETRGRTDHTYVVIGDPGSDEEKVIADPWALFSRAMLEKNFHYASARSRVVHEFTPQYDPEMKAAFTRGGMVSRAEVEREFADFDDALGNPGNQELIRKAVSKGWVYDQFHASNNLGESYRYGSGRDKRYVDQNMTKAEYQEIYSGPRPSAPEPPPRRQSFAAERPTTARRQSFAAERPTTARRQSFAAERPTTARRQSFATEREPRYSTYQSRPPVVEVRDVQPGSSRRSHHQRNRDRESDLNSRSARFASFFFR